MSPSEIFLILSTLLIVSTTTNAYSKYGRTCKDIGCLNSEVCIMKEDPCTYSSQECGRYPTCERASGVSCSNFDCPPGQQCHLEDGQPKCVTSRSVASHVPHSNSDNNPSAPLDPGSVNGGYPGGTTPRPSRPGGAVLPGGSGYMGGQPGSGYPGGSPGSGYPGGNRGSAYPSGNSGYPNGGYPNQGYPNQGYPDYPGQGGGYPAGGYPNQGYGGYQGQNGYQNPYGGQQNGGYGGQQNGGYGGQQQYGTRYGNQPPARGSGSSFTDQLTNGLKVAAGNALKDYLSKTIQKQFQG